MTIPTEPVGSIPRPAELIAACRDMERGARTYEDAEPVFAAAVRDTVARFAATGSPVITDGEQRKHRNFVTYCVDGADGFASDGFELKFDDGRARVLPRLTRGPIRYHTYADRFVHEVRSLSDLPVKQAVIAPSALSLLYPSEDLPDYSREAFIGDLVAEHDKEVRLCFSAGADSVQVDFTEGRLALKLDPSGVLLESFIDLNNMAFHRFGASMRERLGVHTCPGSDCDTHHSQDIDYDIFLPSLFRLDVGRFFIALAGEDDRRAVLKLIRPLLRPGQRVYVGVTDPTDPRVESADEVCERVLEAAAVLPVDQLGTTDDCGFSPFYDDTTTSRDTAFAKIAARVEGTRLAEKELGLV